jgi:hypothetical protein
MRRVLLPSAIMAGSQGMGRTTHAAGLVVPACFSLPLAPDLLATAFPAINMATIVAPTDQHLSAAPCTQKAENVKNFQRIIFVGLRVIASAFSKQHFPYPSSVHQERTILRERPIAVLTLDDRFPRRH